ncbi:MAG: DNA polymerase III subunit delta [Rhodospirillales bacterium]|nr:DNA polymerase III subunit delta [Rhodospirillales bacterium]
MKVAGGRVESFLHQPDPRYRAVLFYGPDLGLVRERADRLVLTAAGSLSDPFRIAEISAESCKDDRARLADEAAAVPFSGGRRVVRVRNAKDVLVDGVQYLFSINSGDGLIVIESGDLGPRSSLRKVFEDAQHGAAIACYLDEGESLRGFIAGELRGHGIAISTDAAEMLAESLGADRALTRSELDKLALYVGEGNPAGIGDVLAVMSGAGEISLDDIVFTACSGNLAGLDRRLTAGFAEGLEAIALLRAVSRHLRRLMAVRALRDGGVPIKQAMETLRPVVFFRLQPAFRRHVEMWKMTHLAQGLALVSECELRCKTSGTPQQLVCKRTMFEVARLAMA